VIKNHLSLGHYGGVLAKSDDASPSGGAETNDNDNDNVA
jgi:hypothetical protein